jgi:hypothetical protein
MNFMSSLLEPHDQEQTMNMIPFGVVKHGSVFLFHSFVYIDLLPKK